MKEFLNKAMIAILAVFAPAQPVLITVGFLILSDSITGIWAAKVRGEPITSAKLRNSISKSIIYMIAVLSAFAIETTILSGIIPIMKIVAGMIAMTELISILENGNTIVGGNIFRALIAKLGSENAKITEVKDDKP